MAVRSSQEDFLLREIRSVVEAIARALGFRSRGDLPAASAEIDDAYAGLLGPQSGLLRMLDVESVVRLLNNSRKIAAMARLTSVDAMLAADAGEKSRADQLLMRGRSLAESAVALDPSDDSAREILSDLQSPQSLE